MKTDQELLELVAKLGLSIDQSHPGSILIRTPLRGPLRGMVYKVQVQGPHDYLRALRDGISHVADQHPSAPDHENL